MAEDVLQYDKMVEDALRGVVRESLTLAAERGLPGDHHFYVTFRTGHPGVVVPERVRAQHPVEMTIVLQHQYWDLMVDADHFEVTLSFNRINERLVIPLAAITAFADPSAKFGLQFQSEFEEAPEGQLETFPTEDAAASDKRATAAEPPNGDKGGEVIALDAWRKK